MNNIAYKTLPQQFNDKYKHVFWEKMINEMETKMEKM